MLLKYRVAKLTLLKYKIPVKLSSLFASPQESCLRGWIMLELFCRFWIRKNHPFNAIIPVMFLRCNVMGGEGSLLVGVRSRVRQ